jgi:hypothetical protein
LVNEPLRRLNGVLEEASRNGEGSTRDGERRAAAEEVGDLLCVNGGTHEDDFKILALLEQGLEDNEEEVG